MVSIHDLNLAKSLSHVDKLIIDKGDINIKKLLKRIDKQSVNYIEWVRKHDTKWAKQGLTEADERAALGTKMVKL